MGRRRVIGVLVGAAVLVALVLAGVIYQSKRIGAARGRLERDVARLRGRRVPTVVLYGPPRAEGCALRECLDVALTLPADLDDPEPRTEAGEPNWPERAALVAQYEPQLAAMEEALRCDGVEGFYAFTGDVFVGSSDHIQPLFRLGKLAEQAIAVRTHEGDLGGATRLCLQTLRLAHDVRRQGVLIDFHLGIEIERIATGRLSEVLEAGLTDEDLEALARRLERLDAAYPEVAEAVDRERVGLVHWLVTEIEGGASGLGVSSPNRVLIRISWPTLDERLRRIGSLAERPYGEVKGAVAEEIEGWKASWNPMVKLFAMPFEGTLRRADEARVRFDALRARCASMR